MSENRKSPALTIKLLHLFFVLFLFFGTNTSLRRRRNLTLGSKGLVSSATQAKQTPDILIIGDEVVGASPVLYNYYTKGKPGFR